MGNDYCDTHEVDIDALPNHDRCPYCRMEEDQRAREVELAQRIAPRSVDDPAPIESYRH